MIRFLLKGLLRDRSRSLFPVLSVSLGVAITVLLHGWLNGVQQMMIDTNARFQTGFVRVMSQAYAENEDILPNDLALLHSDSVLQDLHSRFPDWNWHPRIRFGGLIDVPDNLGETRAQTSVLGWGLELLHPTLPATGEYYTSEKAIFNFEPAMVAGHLPEKPGQVLLSYLLAEDLALQPGDTVTIIGSTMYAGMAVQNFTVAGFVRFGIQALDRRVLIADLADVQYALDMENAVGEIFGYPGDALFIGDSLRAMAGRYNNSQPQDNPFRPMLVALPDQMGLDQLLDIYDIFSFVIIFIFLLVMSIVLWNAGLMSGIRRYGEIGVRLAIGESHGTIYKHMLYEAGLIGIIGSVSGTLLGLSAAWYLQTYGIDISAFMKNTPMMIQDIVRARITRFSFIIGFIPGTGATILGAAISGLGIYRRQTAQLFKELET